MLKKNPTVEVTVTEEIREKMNERATELGFSNRAKYMAAIINQDLENLGVCGLNTTCSGDCNCECETAGPITKLNIDGIEVNIAYRGNEISCSGAANLTADQHIKLGGLLRELVRP